MIISKFYCRLFYFPIRYYSQTRNIPFINSEKMNATYKKSQPRPFSYSVIQTRLNMEQLNDLMINPEIREASTDKSRDNPRKSFWKSLMVDIAASRSLFSNKIRRQFLSSAPVMYIVKQNYEPSWNVFTCLYRNMICRRILRIVNL